jgi:hypothetical protein
MDESTFDDLTRSIVVDGRTRRMLLRLVAGSAFSGFVARLGLADVTEAKSKRSRSRRKRQPQPERKRRGSLQTEGKRKKKHKKKTPPLPPGCQNCGTCQMCQDGQCVGDPDLWLVRCLDNPIDPGGQCHVCAVDGSGNCEPYSNGSACNDGDECSWCQDGQCVPIPEKDLGPCGTSPCHLCVEGTCQPAGQGSDCTDGQGEGFCCHHTCIHPGCDRDRYNPYTCECGCAPGQQLCPDGRCIPDDQCCVACGTFEKCCGGRCMPCPAGGTCGAGTCGCGGEFPKSCPPNPDRPNGYCCAASHAGAPFVSCTARACPDCPEFWACSYVG